MHHVIDVEQYERTAVGLMCYRS